MFLFALRKCLKIIFALAAGLLLLAAGCYFFPQQILTVDSGPVKADALVVLGGAGLDRPGRAAALFKQGEAPLVICSGYGDAGIYKSCLVRSGVPARDIVLETRSHTTRQNAERTIALLRARRLHSAIIVTSWYHSRRALACFEHYGRGMKFYSRPSYFDYGGKASGGRQRAGPTARKAEMEEARRHADSEYLKLLGYWVCYGVCPV